MRISDWSSDVCSSDLAAVDAAFAETVRALDRVDACFVNAGVSGRSAGQGFVDMTAAEWRRVLSVNLDGAFFTLRAAARHMVERAKDGDTAGGRLVGMASTASVHGAPRAESYAASKGAMVSVIGPLAVEMARPGTQANSFSPGRSGTEVNRAGRT